MIIYTSTIKFIIQRFKKSYPFTAPKVRPLIKCLCIKKNIITGGSAAMTEPAEIKL